MKIAVISFTKNGSRCSARIVRYLNEKGHRCEGYAVAAYADGSLVRPLTTSVQRWTGNAFEIYEALIFVGAAGIAVRSIAPFVRDKLTDPAVVVIDEKGQYVIPILSGHVGGANELANELADELGALSVLTTATDVQKRFAVDVFAVKNGLLLTDRMKAKMISADILNGMSIGIYFGDERLWPEAVNDGGSQRPVSAGNRVLPEELYIVQNPKESRIAIDYHRMDEGVAALHLIPKDFLWIGIGCKKGTDEQSIEAALQQFMEKHRLCADAVAGIASIDIKSDEPGILSFCHRYHWPFRTFSVEELLAVPGDFTASDFVRQHTGVDNVCERAAVCGAGAGGRLIIGKQRWPGITLAAAIMNRRLYFG